MPLIPSFLYAISSGLLGRMGLPRTCYPQAPVDKLQVSNYRYLYRFVRPTDRASARSLPCPPRPRDRGGRDQLAVDNSRYPPGYPRHRAARGRDQLTVGHSRRQFPCPPPPRARPGQRGGRDQLTVEARPTDRWLPGTSGKPVLGDWLTVGGATN